jgi:hypothetical protein
MVYPVHARADNNFSQQKIKAIADLDIGMMEHDHGKKYQAVQNDRCYADPEKREN